jgi:hypothetical protein
MRLQQDGDLEVSMAEIVTVEIEAFDTAFLAHTGPLQLGQWTAVTRVSPTKEVRTFVVTPTFSTNFAFATGFDFSPAAGGRIPATARYTIRISGSGPGGFVRQRTIEPIAILPTTRVFSFEVGQG